jgi:hypothetical protein
MKKVFSFDCESNGLWGQIFAVAAVVTSEDGQIIDSFMGQCPINGEINEWVRANVLPTLENVPRYESYRDLLEDFAKFYMKHKSDSDVVTHMGYIVEAKLLRDLREFGLIGEWDGPFPMYDVSGHLQLMGEEPTSVDAYAEKYGVVVGIEGSTHNPLYDSAVTAKVYLHLLDRAKKLCQQAG